MGIIAATHGVTVDVIINFPVGVGVIIPEVLRGGRARASTRRRCRQCRGEQGDFGERGESRGSKRGDRKSVV